jgi:hypothetical protein
MFSANQGPIEEQECSGLTNSHRARPNWTGDDPKAINWRDGWEIRTPGHIGKCFRDEFVS